MSADEHALCRELRYDAFKRGFERGAGVRLWPELPLTLRVAAESLRTLTGKRENWTDLNQLADDIEKVFAE